VYRPTCNAVDNVKHDRTLILYIDCIEDKRSMSKIEIVEKFNCEVSITHEKYTAVRFLEFVFRQKYYCVWH